MAILSKRVIEEVGRSYRRAYGLRTVFMNLSGAVATAHAGRVPAVDNARRRRDYALQQSISLGEPYVYDPVPGVATCVVPLEHKRMIHGALLGGHVRLDGVSRPETAKYMTQHGTDAATAAAFLDALPVWSRGRLEEAAAFLYRTFYEISGWRPELLEENRLRTLRQEQVNRAIEDQRRSGKQALYAFDKERILLANIRAGDRNGARSVLNEMLATIYLSSPGLAVLRARTVELLSYLTRAAVEDNALLETLIERNHGWTEKLVEAEDSDALSRELTAALDEFMEVVYLQGQNRLNVKVSRALDFIARNYAARISLRDVAVEVGLSPGRLAHLMKQFTGRTVMQTICRARISSAERLLRRTSRSCTEIAYEVGFWDQSYFIKQFKRITGTTPLRFRRSRAGKRRDGASAGTRRGRHRPAEEEERKD